MAECPKCNKEMRWLRLFDIFVCSFCGHKKSGVLKFCPFCGQLARLETSSRSNGKEELYRVACNNRSCPVKPYTVYFYSKGDAIKAWNTRANEKGGSE